MVQATLVQQPAIALRLMVAHAIAGSRLWNVRPDPLRAPNPAIEGSHGQCSARVGFKKAQMTAADLLGIEAGDDAITGSKDMDITSLFHRLCPLSDEDVLSVLSVVMAETMAVGNSIVETAGIALAVNPVDYWQADDTFLALVRQREVLGTLIGEVAGEAVAANNVHERAKTLRGILGDCLTGANGRSKAEPWVPRWMGFPATAYVDRPADENKGAGGDRVSVERDDALPRDNEDTEEEDDNARDDLEEVAELS